MKYRLLVLFILAFLRVSGQAVPLTGPWKFHTGDDPTWANPLYDDSEWETVDLTPKAGAHDGDVGLSNYVSGWQSNGHKGYTGFAWYRLRVPVAKGRHEPLILAGPAAADDIYQVFADGKLLGGIGDFSTESPEIYAIQPRLFTLPSTTADSVTIAIRTWAGPQTIAGDSTSGGIRIAPILGTKANVYPYYHRQWRQTFWGYVVDAIEPLLFLILAILSLRRSRQHAFYGWLAASLIITALVRVSQVTYFWGQWESLTFYYFSKEILLVPLSFGAWIITWSVWYELKSRWWKLIIYILCINYINTRFSSHVWQYHSINTNAATCSQIIHLLRLVLLAIAIIVVVLGVMRQKRHLCLVLTIVLLSLIGIFASELSTIGVPGIWFPFGVGVSRTQYAYAVMVPLLFILLMGRRENKVL